MLNFFNSSSSSSTPSKSISNSNPNSNSKSKSNPNLSKPTPSTYSTSTSTSTSTSKSKAKATAPSKSISSPVVVTTVKKHKSSTSTKLDQSQNHKYAQISTSSHNRLPEETRRRIENDRRSKAIKVKQDSISSNRTKDSRQNSKPVDPTSKGSKKRAIEALSDESDETTDDDQDDSDDDDYSKKVKKNSSFSSKWKNNLIRQATEESSSDPIDSAWRDMGRKGVTGSYNVPRDIFEEKRCSFLTHDELNDGIDETEKDSNGDSIRKPIQSAEIVRAGTTYCDYFNDLPSPHNLVQLSYPAIGAYEDFLLLVSRDADEYDPISELLRTIYSIVSNLLTEDQRKEYNFGDLEMLECGSLAGMVSHNNNSHGSGIHKETHSNNLTAPPSPAPSSPNVHNSNAQTSISQRLSNVNGLNSIPTPEQSSSTCDSPISQSQNIDSPQSQYHLHQSQVNASNGSIPSSHQSLPSFLDPSSETYGFSTLPTTASTDPILRSLTKARNRKSGPLFLYALKRFNLALEKLKSNGAIRNNLVKIGKERGVEEGVWRMIQEQCYARTVGPKVEALGDYAAFSDNVYGELLPKFLSEVLELVSLKPSSIFVDLGSGVGNLLIQASLQTGCSSYGIEQMENPALFASKQLSEAKKRWRMWSLKGSAELKSFQGDFSENEEIREILKKADLIVCNNYAFTAKTNEVLSYLFLDLKDGARIVSLKPFVNKDFRLTGRTLGSPSAIFKTERRKFVTGCVSWMDGGGNYYIHTIDRSMIKNFTQSEASRENSLSRTSSPNSTPQKRRKSQKE